MNLHRRELLKTAALGMDATAVRPVAVQGRADEPEEFRTRTRQARNSKTADPEQAVPSET